MRVHVTSFQLMLLLAGCGACASTSANPPLANDTMVASGKGGGGGVGAGGPAKGGSVGAGNAAGSDAPGGGSAVAGGAGGRLAGGGGGAGGGSGGVAGSAAASGGSAGMAALAGMGGGGPSVRPRGQVSVGGVEGFASFVDPSSTAALVAGGASLYIHQVGWGQLASDDDRRKIAGNWASAGGAVVEMAEATDLAASFTDLGVPSILEVNVNSPSCSHGPADDDSIATWTNWVASYKSHGVLRAQYNDTPNCQTSGFDWNSSLWDDSRTRAQIGGGVILDAPPYFYYSIETDGYRAFVKAEIAWANGAGLHSTWILSPFTEGNFLTDTQRLIAELNQLPANERPQEYAVENYGQGELVGRDTDADSVASVALWVLANAKTYQP